MENARLQIHDLTYTYPGALKPALSAVNLTVRRGECVCVTGASGCGKSTLLLAMAHALQDGRRSGSVELPAAEGDVPAGILFQNAEAQILCATVGEEVAFGPENLCVPPSEIASRVARALAEVGLDGEQRRSVERFSAGQKQRLALASVLSMNPSIILLDELTSQLDRRG